MPTAIEELMEFAGGETDFGFAGPEIETPSLSPDEAMRNFDLPIPGQSLTKEPGEAAYEQPPQFTKVEEAMDFIVDRITVPPIQKNLLRMMDAGTPVALIIEPILLHGAQEGKWNVDMALTLMEPVATVMYGLGKRAGIEPKMFAPKKKDTGIDPRPLEQMFKKETSERKQRFMEDLKKPEIKQEQPKGLLTRPAKETI